MATPRPKYTAVVHFSAAGRHFAPGDPVPAGLALDAVLLNAPDFVTRSTKPTADTQQPVGPDEGSQQEETPTS